MIYYKSGAYGWNDELECVVDTEQFELALQNAEKAARAAQCPDRRARGQSAFVYSPWRDGHAAHDPRAAGYARAQGGRSPRGDDPGVSWGE